MESAVIGGGWRENAGFGVFWAGNEANDNEYRTSNSEWRSWIGTGGPGTMTLGQYSCKGTFRRVGRRL